MTRPEDINPAATASGPRLCSVCKKRPRSDAAYDPSPRDPKLCFQCNNRNRFMEGIPQRFWDATIDEVRANQPPAVVAGIDKFDKGDCDGLVLIGPPGTGKTYTAAAWIRHYLKDFEDCPPFKFTTVIDMLDQLRPDRAGIDTYQDADLLVLDDLGRERLTTEWAAESLFQVVDYRWRTQPGPWIVTTNYEPEALARRVGDALVDRLVDNAIGVRFTGQSMRRMAS